MTRNNTERHEYASISRKQMAAKQQQSLLISLLQQSAQDRWLVGTNNEERQLKVGCQLELHFIC